jgi:hypothetical protein
VLGGRGALLAQLVERELLADPAVAVDELDQRIEPERRVEPPAALLDRFVETRAAGRLSPGERGVGSGRSLSLGGRRQRVGAY